MGSAAFSQHRAGRAQYTALPDNYTALKSCAGFVRAEYGLGRSRSRAWLVSSLSLPSPSFLFSNLFMLYFAFKGQQPQNEAQTAQPEERSCSVCARAGTALCSWWMSRATDSKDSAPAGKATPVKLCWYFGQ